MMKIEKVWKTFEADASTWAQGIYMGERLHGRVISILEFGDERANCFCLAGAVMKKHGHLGVYVPELDHAITNDLAKLAAAIRRRPGAVGVSFLDVVTVFNDDEGRTIEEVIEVAKEADV